MNKSKILLNKISSALTIMVMAAALFPVSPAEAAMVPGGAVGPVNPNTGFPNWYMDQNGLALELMEAADTHGISAPVEPGNLFSQQIGFGAEGFWWSTESSITNANIDALLVLAMEAAFAGESAVNGEQSAFGRVRFTIDVPAVGTYVVKYPYGTETFVVSALEPGPEIKNAGADIGCFAIAGVASCDPNTPPGNPNNFGIALQSGIGPFLTWDTFNINPALSDPLLVNSAMPGKRYVGNAAIEHAIKGSPVGQNFYRIEGPEGVDLDPALPGIQTAVQNNLFVVTGRIAVIDTVAPTIVSTSPAVVNVGATNIIANVNISDDIGVRSATIDLGALGSTLNATLNGAQEVPATPSPATGSGTFTIDTTANTLSFNITASGLTGGAETGAHIHGPASSGVNAPILFELPLGASKVGTWTYPEASEADILAGNMYVNIHTLLFPNGEIRGQIVPASNVQNMVLTAGTITNGTWGIVIPSASRLGTFSLPITTHDGSNTATGSMTLSVVPVLNSVTVTPAASDVVAGATQQLSVTGLDPTGATIASGLTTTWSSNSLVATVDANGLVTGAVAGTAVITATVTNGVNTVSGTATVTVSAANPGVCQTTADTSADGIIGNLEILNFVRNWKSGLVSNLDILRAIVFWKVGSGC